MLNQYCHVYECQYQPEMQMLCLLHLINFLVQINLLTFSAAQNATHQCLNSLAKLSAGFAV